MLVGSYQGDGAANGGTYGNGPELTLAGPAIRAVAILAQGNEATAEEPWANLRGDTSLIEEGQEPPQGTSAPRPGTKAANVPEGSTGRSVERWQYVHARYS